MSTLSLELDEDWLDSWPSCGNPSIKRLSSSLSWNYTGSESFRVAGQPTP
jgi:hypothetical protein